MDINHQLNVTTELFCIILFFLSYFAALDLPPQCIEEGQLMLEALNGFLIFISKKGKIQFVSTTVEDHLGWKQVRIEVVPCQCCHLLLTGFRMFDQLKS